MEGVQIGMERDREAGSVRVDREIERNREGREEGGREGEGILGEWGRQEGRKCCEGKDVEGRTGRKGYRELLSYAKKQGLYSRPLSSISG